MQQIVRSQGEQPVVRDSLRPLTYARMLGQGSRLLHLQYMACHFSYLESSNVLAGVHLISRKSHFMKYLVSKFEHWQSIVWVYGI